jgi:hypothetical protein
MAISWWKWSWMYTNINALGRFETADPLFVRYLSLFLIKQAVTWIRFLGVVRNTAHALLWRFCLNSQLLHVA